jgi:Icc-related predicted phosphoesterase
LLIVGGCGPLPDQVNAPEGNRGGTGGGSGAHFYFVQLSDTHWGAKDGLAMTRSAVELINRLPVKVEFVAITGDLFSDSIQNAQIVREAVEVLKNLKTPVYCVPGNHDLLQADFERSRSIFERNFGKTEQLVEVKGVTCLFLCTEFPDGEKRSPWQIERTAIAKVAAASAAPLLIFMHRPPLREMVGPPDKPAEPWGEVTDLRWNQLFAEFPAVKGVFAGHFHRDEMVWVGLVPVYVAPALARFWDRQPAFRLYEYRNGQINYWTLYPERSQRR